jgi:hypothetical protein
LVRAPCHMSPMGVGEEACLRRRRLLFRADTSKTNSDGVDAYELRGER